MKKFIDFLNESNVQSYANSKLVGNIVNEAAFKPGNVDKINKLYGRLFGKKFGGEFKVLFAEDFTRANGEKGKGYRMMNSNGYQIRLNYTIGTMKVLSQSFSKESFVIDSIDYWNNKNTDFGKPTLTARFAKSTNVVKIWDKLSKLLKSEKVGIFNDINEDVNIAGSTVLDRFDFLQNRGLTKSHGRDAAKFTKAINDAGLEQEWEEYRLTLEKGKSETNTATRAISQRAKEVEEIYYSDPELIFQDIEDLTEALARSVGQSGDTIRSLIICGQGGVGKTYNVEKTLERVIGRKGVDWAYHSGTGASNRTFFTAVYPDRDKVIVFDEADMIFQNPDLVVMLKPALDSNSYTVFEYLTGMEPLKGIDNIRDYCDKFDKYLDKGGIPYIGSKPKPGGDMRFPSKFVFDGRMIFISNMPASKLDQAILSRSLFIDVHLAESDMRNHCITVAKKRGTTDAELEILQRALAMNSEIDEPEIKYMTPEIARKKKPVTIRSTVIGLAIIRAGLERAEYLISMYA